MRRASTIYEDIMDEYRKDLTNRNNKQKEKIKLQNLKCDFTKKFLYSIVKEHNTKQVTEHYKKKLKEIRKSIRTARFFPSKKEKSILEYSFLNDQNNKKKSHKTETVPNNINTTHIAHYRGSIIKMNTFKSSKNFSEKYEKYCIKKQETKFSNYKPTIIKLIRQNNLSNKNIKKIPKITKINKLKKNKSAVFINNDLQITDNIIDLKENPTEKFNNEKTKKKVCNQKRFQKWYELEAEYEKIRKLKLEIIKNEVEANRKIIEDEERKQETFKPRINKKSIQIFNKNYSNMKFNDRLDKLYKNQKIKDQKAYKFTFIPSSYSARTKMQTQEKLRYLI